MGYRCYRDIDTLDPLSDFVNSTFSRIHNGIYMSLSYNYAKMLKYFMTNKRIVTNTKEDYIVTYNHNKQNTIKSFSNNLKSKDTKIVVYYTIYYLYDYYHYYSCTLTQTPGAGDTVNK